MVLRWCAMTLVPGLLKTNAQSKSDPSSMPCCVAVSLGKGPLVFLVGYIAVAQESQACAWRYFVLMNEQPEQKVASCQHSLFIYLCVCPCLLWNKQKCAGWCLIQSPTWLSWWSPRCLQSHSSSSVRQAQQHWPVKRRDCSPLLCTGHGDGGSSHVWGKAAGERAWRQRTRAGLLGQGRRSEGNLGRCWCSCCSPNLW